MNSNGRITMYDYQMNAIDNMRNGCILCGGVGSGKSRTSLAYFYTQYGGKLNVNNYNKMISPPDLYIITTARKRDMLEWDGELLTFGMSPYPNITQYPKQKITVDSWNNITKYVDVNNAFFIFDEQRVVGSGAWVKSFLKITKTNKWILLSATPGDTWSDYIPVFIANGFYKNKTEFMREHAVYARFSKFPQVEKFINTNKLLYFKRKLLVEMNLERSTVRHYKDVLVNYDKKIYKKINVERWDPIKDEPIENPSTLCYLLRRLCNSDKTRGDVVLDLTKTHKRLIIFYNFDYELDILKNLKYRSDIKVAEWNGHKHELIPDSKSWVYLVQYTAGCEGWNCITTDSMIFYSQNYSYKVMEQAAGRIDRVNTKFKDLYYYVLKSRSGIDLSIAKAIREKKKFNEARWVSKI